MSTMSVGEYLVREAIPEKYRSRLHSADPDGIETFLRSVSDEMHPDDYRDMLHGIFETGSELAYYEGNSFKLKDFETPPLAAAIRADLKKRIKSILNGPGEMDSKEALIKNLVAETLPDVDKAMYDEALASGSGLAQQVASKTRGKVADLRSILWGDGLMKGNDGDVLAIPLLHGYAEGITPSEYFANTYGTRDGVISVKKSTADAGYLAKKIKQVSHRQVVTESDCGVKIGSKVDADDTDNIGSILAQDVGSFKAGQPITDTIRRKLSGQEIYVRSPLVCRAEGICSKCAGIREKTGRLPDIGENLGIQAGQDVGEKSTQTALSSKHSSGRVDGQGRQFVSGFELLEQLMDVPADFRDAATMASVDGVVSDIREAPQGGHYVNVGDVQHYVPEGMEMLIKPGTDVEAGEVLTTGIPNPAELVKYRGIGDARRTFIKGMQTSGANRRNLELVARGFVDYVSIDDPEAFYDLSPGDKVRYSRIARDYKPRKSAKEVGLGSAKGQYLEQEFGPYTIGTRVTRRVIDELQRSGVKKVLSSPDEPAFTPTMVPSVRGLMSAEDWRERAGGYYLKDSLLDAAARGLKSPKRSVSYYGPLMEGVGFGDELDTTGKY